MECLMLHSTILFSFLTNLLLLVLPLSGFQRDNITISRLDGKILKGCIVYQSDLVQIQNITEAFPVFNGNKIIKNVTNRVFTSNKDIITDAVGKQILEMRSQYKMYETPTLEFVESLSSEFSSIAIDLVHLNLYWSDEAYRWIAMKSLLPDSKSNQKVILDNLYFVGDIACSPLYGYLFWIKRKNDPSIYRSSLNGSSKRVIVYLNLVEPVQIETDPAERTIYWYDAKRKVLEFAAFDGNERGVIPTGELKINGFLVLNSTVILVYETSSINAIVMSEGNDIFLQRPIVVLGYNITDISNVAINRRSLGNQADSCLELYCEHFCVYDTEGPKCSCDENSVLHMDGHSCLDSPRYYRNALFLLIDGKVCQTNVEYLTDPRHNITCLNTFRNASALDIDIRNRVLYVVVDARRRIVQFNIDREFESTVLESNYDIEHIAYDWKYRIIFWTSNSSIYKISTETGHRATVESGVNIHDLETNPENGQLLWSVRNQNQIVILSIEDGKKTYLNLAVEAFNLKYRKEEKRIYFTTTNDIMAVKTNDSKLSTIAELNYYPGPINAFKEFLVWGDTTKSSIVSKVLGLPETVFKTRISVQDKLYDIKLFYETEQQLLTDPCRVSSDRCQDICVPTDDSQTKTCSCAPGRTLSNDSHSCKQTSVNASDTFLVVYDESSGKVFKVELQQGNISLLPVELPIHSMSLNKASNDVVMVSGEDTIKLYNLRTSESVQVKSLKDVMLAVYYNKTKSFVFVDKIGKVWIQIDKTLREVESKVTKLTPIDIALNEENGMVYISIRGQSNIQTLELGAKINMNALVIPPSIQPSGLDVDGKGNSLYFIDANSDYIMIKNLDTGDLSYTKQIKGAMLVDVAVDLSYIYTVGLKSRFIYICQRGDYRNMTRIPISPYLGRIGSLHINTKYYLGEMERTGEKTLAASAVMNEGTDIFTIIPFVIYWFVS